MGIDLELGGAAARIADRMGDAAAICGTGADGRRIRHANAAFAALCGGADPVGGPIPFADDDARAALDRALEGGRPARAELSLPVADGPALWCEVSVTPLGDDPAGPRLWVVRDVTERRLEREALAEAAREFERQANSDPLTGLSTLAHARRRLGFLALRARRRGGALAALHVDLGHLRGLERARGRAAAEDALRRAAERLRANVRAADAVARAGDHAFLVLAAVSEGEAAARALASRLRDLLSDPAEAEAGAPPAAVSIGAALASGTGDPADALEGAEHAMRRARAEVRAGAPGAVALLGRAEARALAARRALAAELPAALEADAIEPAYRPLVRAADGAVVGVAATPLWRRPDGPPLDAAAMAEAARAAGAEAAVADRMLARAAADWRGWREAGLAPPRLSVDLDARRLRDPGFAAVLRGLGLPPGAIALELRGADGPDPPDDHALAALDALRELGHPLVATGFGAGPLSLLALGRIAPDRLRMAPAIAAAAPTCPARRRLARLCRDTAAALGAAADAEGAETGAHVALLGDLGFELLQGAAFGPPLPAAEFARVLPGSAGRAAAAAG